MERVWSVAVRPPATQKLANSARKRLKAWNKIVVKRFHPPASSLVADAEGRR